MDRKRGHIAEYSTNIGPKRTRTRTAASFVDLGSRRRRDIDHHTPTSLDHLSDKEHKSSDVVEGDLGRRTAHLGGRTPQNAHDPADRIEPILGYGNCSCDYPLVRV